MINYKIYTDKPSQHYLQIEISYHPTQVIETIQLPSWRPGRYELGNFAKNVRNFKVTNQDRQELIYQKITKDRWEFNTSQSESIIISYEYYAIDLNAGSTFFSIDQVYINPVNCLMYIDGRENESCSLELFIPDNFTIACSLSIHGNILNASNFDELADSPLICSPTLQHRTYAVDETIFHLWFQGEVKVDWEKLIPDFTSFTEKQIEKFGEFPVDEYHFLFQIVPFRAYHGVEHCRSTVILLGPSHAVFNDFYSDLLGVSSHELYHTWNVKAIRPIEMFPYNFAKENYSELGYLCEGVTTYMGDLMLFKSNVIGLADYMKELNVQIQKHVENFGRYNYSVAHSSFDTWLDGYVPGTPSRKVSIYTEGCMIALICDIMIIHESNGKYGLDDAMKDLFENFARKNKGVSENDYKKILEKFSGTSFDEIFQEYIHGKKDYIALLTKNLIKIGLQLKSKQTGKISQDRFGIKTIVNGNSFIIKQIFPNSPADLAQLMIDDEIVAIKRTECLGELDKLIVQYLQEEKIEFLIKRRNKFIDIEIELNENQYFPEYFIEYSEETIKNNRLFKKWIS
jgi:predicted metalloprotease with PDZ domain